MNPAFGGATHAARSAHQFAPGSGPDEQTILIGMGLLFGGIVVLFLLQLVWEWIESKLPERWK